MLEVLFFILYNEIVEGRRWQKNNLDAKRERYCR